MAERKNREDLEPEKLQKDVPEELEAEEIDDESMEDVSGGGNNCACHTPL